MSVHNEPWQVFGPNGAPVDKLYLHRDEFSSVHIMGASHVWLWRLRNGKKELLLQQRSRNKATWPGYFDISAAGHIDGGESPLQSAKREAQEELGLDIATDNLQYIFSLRTPAAKNEIDHVYLYEVDLTFEPSFEMVRLCRRCGWV